MLPPDGSFEDGAVPEDDPYETAMAELHAAVDGPELLFEALSGLPFMDDVYVQMQARNLAMVNAHIADVEKELMAEWAAADRMPTGSVLFASALTQMWLFALYELLRTWRQRVRERSPALPEEERASVLERLERFKTVYAELEGVRVTLAKHEVPKAKNRPAEAAGYARVDYLTGAMTYPWSDKNDIWTMSSRPGLVEGVLLAASDRDLPSPPEV